MDLKEENRIFSPEEIQKLKGYMGFSSEDSFLYTPKIYRAVFPENKDKWPVFKLRGLNGYQVAKAQDDVGVYSPGTDKMQFNTGAQRIKTIESNVLGWKNLFGMDGKEILFKQNGQKVHIQCIEKLPAPLQMELHEAINERSYLNHEELEGLEF